MLRQSLRGFLTHPGFTLVMVVSLAMGVGAATSAYYAVDRFLLHPLALEDPDRLVELKLQWQPDGTIEPISYPSFLDYRGKEPFSDLAVFSDVQTILHDGEVARQVDAQVVSTNYFDLLGVKMTLGRGFGEEELTAPVVVLSWELWRSHFQQDPAILGTSVRLKDQRFTVVGVASREFHGLHLAEPADLWVPVGRYRELASGFMAFLPVLEERGIRWLEAVGRLRDGVSLEAAEGRASLLARELTATSSRAADQLTIRLTPAEVAALGRERRDKLADFFNLLVLVVLLELGITSSNLGAVLFARALEHRHEAAIRFALGASRWRFVQRLFVEVFALALLGALLGLGLTKLLLASAGGWKLAGLPTLAPPGAQIGLVHLAFAIGLALTIATTFSVPVTWRLSRLSPADELKDHTPQAGFARHSLRKLVIAAQVAVALVLLVGTGLFTRSLLRAWSADPGFRTSGVLHVELDPGLAGYSETRARGFYRDVRERLSVMSHVQSSAWAARVPLGRREIEMGVELSGTRAAGETPQIQTNVISPGFFETLGIHLEGGRDFASSDGPDGGRVAIVSAALASRYWPGEDPLRQSIELPGSERGRLQVIGVASDVKVKNLDEEPHPLLYLPLSQQFDLVGLGPMHLLIETPGGAPDELVPEVRAAVRQLGADVPVLSARPLRESLRQRFVPQQLGAGVLGLLGAFAAISVAAGVYGLLASFLAQNKREMGLRMALGAGSREVLRLMVSRALLPLLAGLVAGAAGVALLLRLISDLLYGIEPLDVPTFFTALGMITLTAALASFLPIFQALLVKPAEVLRKA